MCDSVATPTQGVLNLKQRIELATRSETEPFASPYATAYQQDGIENPVAHLKQQFRDALQAIEPGDDKVNAPDAHQQVRAALRDDPVLTEYGIDPILIGSYKRNVSIRRVKDVDVFVRLPEIPSATSSADLLDRFFSILHREFGHDDDGHRRTKRQDRSLQVSFPEYDLHVDAVPARRHGDGRNWEIPQKGDINKWVRTNPDALTQLSSTVNALHGELYVPTIKLMRQTRRALLGNKKPGGFFVEAATYQAFSSGVVSGNDHAEYYCSALNALSDIISNFVLYGIGINDPTLPGDQIQVRASDEELDHMRIKFSDAAAVAAQALADEDIGAAAVKFRSLLGKNGDSEIVFPMPPGYDQDGTKRASVITAGDRVVPAGRRTFG